MSQLWKTDQPEDWTSMLDSYWKTVTEFESSQAKKKLLSLDRWFFDTFCPKVAKEGTMAKSDLVKLVDWKLTRGKWRPRLLSFAEQADEKQLKDAFIQAHAVLSKNKSKPPSDEAIKEAATALCDLKGIGPATASAILTAISPSIPFMSDEALVAALGSRDYTVKFMLQLTEKLRSKAKKLSAADGKKEWTARDVERCLYAEALKEKLSEKKDLQPAKKKQRKA